jgi:hypothetical protein
MCRVNELSAGLSCNQLVDGKIECAKIDDRGSVVRIEKTLKNFLKLRMMMSMQVSRCQATSGSSIKTITRR